MGFFITRSSAPAPAPRAAAPRTRECPECGGDGIDWGLRPPRSHLQSCVNTGPCSECEGTGRVPA